MKTKRRKEIDWGELNALNNNTPLVEGGDNFQECVKLFLEEMEIRNLAYHTLRWYKENLLAVQKTLEILKLSTEPINITDKTIKECILYWKRDRKLSPTTINHRISSLKRLFAYLNKEGLINNIPTIGIDKLKTKRSIIKPFEEDELKKVLSQPNKKTFVGFRDFTIMLVLLDTGVRLIELEKMKIYDVDLRRNKILVLGKGAREREVVFQSTTKSYLRRYMLLRGDVDHDYLWITYTGTPFSRRSFERTLMDYGKMAGLTNVRVSPHTFRHTCAKMYIQNSGHDPRKKIIIGDYSLEATL